MRVTNTLLRVRSSRLPQMEREVPYEEILPLMLKNRVSGKGNKTSNVCCLQEMFVLFSCLKTNDFRESPCMKEVQTFQQCYVDNIAAKEQKKELDKKGQLIPGAKKMGYVQINQLLKMYPSRKPRKSTA